MVRFSLTLPTGDLLKPPLLGLVDSGADTSMFPIALMADLGLAEADCHKHDAQGVGGGTHCFTWRGGTLEADFYGVKVALQVRFSQTPIILLGREDFFARFQVQFNQAARRFILEEL